MEMMNFKVICMVCGAENVAEGDEEQVCITVSLDLTDEKVSLSCNKCGYSYDIFVKQDFENARKGEEENHDR